MRATLPPPAIWALYRGCPPWSSPPAWRFRYGRRRVDLWCRPSGLHGNVPCRIFPWPSWGETEGCSAPPAGRPVSYGLLSLPIPGSRLQPWNTCPPVQAQGRSPNHPHTWPLRYSTARAWQWRTGPAPDAPRYSASWKCGRHFEPHQSGSCDDRQDQHDNPMDRPVRVDDLTEHRQTL